jgi:hypothetical protein
LHFDYIGIRAEKVGNPGKKCENSIRAEKNQILCNEIEPNPSKDRAMHLIQEAQGHIAHLSNLGPYRNIICISFPLAPFDPWGPMI